MCKLKLKSRYCYICNIFLIISIINIFTINDIMAGGGGGGDPPPPAVCTPDVVRSMIGGSGCNCTPYSPSLPSWDQIRSSRSRIYSFSVGFNTTPSSGYTILDASLFSNYISCNRYSNSGYTPRGEGISGGRYCNKLVVGISNDYMNSVIQHGPRSPRPNVDIKVFCNDIRTSNYFDHNDPIVGRSYMLSSDYYVCRDGSVHSGNGSCKVATEYKLKSEEYKECHTEEVCASTSKCSKSDYKSGKCTDGQKGYCNGDEMKTVTKCKTFHRCVDGTTYDTGKTDLTRYDISICHQHYVTDSITNINVTEIYDPNMVYHDN